MNKQNMEYASNSAVKRNDVLTRAATRTRPGNIMLSQGSQRRRPHAGWFHLCEMSRTGKFIETESRLAVARNWGEDRMGSD